MMTPEELDQVTVHSRVDFSDAHFSLKYGQNASVVALKGHAYGNEHNAEVLELRLADRSIQDFHADYLILIDKYDEKAVSAIQNWLSK